MEITEKELEDLIFTDLQFDPYSLVATGLDLSLVTLPSPNRVHWHRQVDLKHYGRADIVGWTRYKGQIYVDVVELKNVPITNNDFNQVLRYRHAIEEAFNNSVKLTRYWLRIHVSCYLIGRDLNECHFVNNNTDVKVYTYKFGLKGFQFDTAKGKWHYGSGNLSLQQLRSGSSLISHSINRTTKDAEKVY